MFKKEEFIDNSSELLEWIASYLNDVENFPVRSNLSYGDIRSQLPEFPPLKPENISTIFKDFKSIVLLGITHWQSPNYFAYFPANSSTPSLLAEFLTAALGVQAMKWVTSPASTELEEQMLLWLQKMLGLSNAFTGVLQDTASVSTLCAILAARERATNYESNKIGIRKVLRVYCSSEAHSSVEKAVRIAGFGSDNLVKIGVDDEMRMIPSSLQKAISEDLQNGYVPACIVAALGTTGTCAVDPIDEISHIAAQHKIWLHIDAAFAGTALVLPEYRDTIQGLEIADSFVFNPHKWMFTNFDCSAFFVKNPDQLKQTFSLVPSYLETTENKEANDYSNWGIQLGRRFRALKLWFVIRNFGVEGIQSKLREHIQLAIFFEKKISKNPAFEILVPRNLVVICFRLKPSNYNSLDLNDLNSKFLEKLNESGKLYLSHCMINGNFSLRFVCAQTHTEHKHVENALATLEMIARELI